MSFLLLYHLDLVLVDCNGKDSNSQKTSSEKYVFHKLSPFLQLQRRVSESVTMEVYFHKQKKETSFGLQILDSFISQFIVSVRVSVSVGASLEPTVELLVFRGQISFVN
ncbi:hypothetical protein [Bacillus phage PK2]|nr:hypothetical protein [Bacillus phage PK2]